MIFGSILEALLNGNPWKKCDKAGPNLFIFLTQAIGDKISHRYHFCCLFASNASIASSNFKVWGNAEWRLQGSWIPKNQPKSTVAHDWSLGSVTWAPSTPELECDVTLNGVIQNNNTGCSNVLVFVLSVVVFTVSCQQIWSVHTRNTCLGYQF